MSGGKTGSEPKLPVDVPEGDQDLLDEAREETLRRVKQDLQRVTTGVKPLLNVLLDGLAPTGSESLFRPGLDEHRIAKACGANADSLRQFKAQLGLELSPYLTRCKVDAAKGLLRYHDLKIWRIAIFTGYAGPQSFSRAFTAWTGNSPAAFRRKAVPRERRFLPATELNSDKFWWLTTLGVGNPKSRAEVRERFRLLCVPEPQDSGEEASPLLRVLTAGTEREKIVAESLWEMLANLPQAEQRRWIRHLRADSPALFHLLLEKCDEVGRNEPHRGLELAQLALEHLQWNVLFPPEQVPNLRAFGLAWLAAAHRRVNDFSAAARLFDDAWETWKIGEDRRVEGEICVLEGTFKMFQRSYEEALRLFARSIALAHANGYSGLLVRSLLQRASIIAYSGSPQEAITDLRVALHHLESLQEPYLELTAYAHLATAHTLAGNHREALEVLSKAEELAKALEEPIAGYHLQWIRGLANQGSGNPLGAERLFEEARGGFIEAAAMEQAALVSLDLAILKYDQGLQVEVMRLAAAAIPALEALSIGNERTVAGELLREAIGADQLTIEVLSEAREVLAGALLQPRPEGGLHGW